MAGSFQYVPLPRYRCIVLQKKGHTLRYERHACPLCVCMRAFFFFFDRAVAHTSNSTWSMDVPLTCITYMLCHVLCTVPIKLSGTTLFSSLCKISKLRMSRFPYDFKEHLRWAHRSFERHRSFGKLRGVAINKISSRFSHIRWDNTPWRTIAKACEHMIPLEFDITIG